MGTVTLRPISSVRVKPPTQHLVHTLPMSIGSMCLTPTSSLTDQLITLAMMTSESHQVSPPWVWATIMLITIFVLPILMSLTPATVFSRPSAVTQTLPIKPVAVTPSAPLATLPLASVELQMPVVVPLSTRTSATGTSVPLRHTSTPILPGTTGRTFNRKISLPPPTTCGRLATVAAMMTLVVTVVSPFHPSHTMSWVRTSDSTSVHFTTWVWASLKLRLCRQAVLPLIQMVSSIQIELFGHTTCTPLTASRLLSPSTLPVSTTVT